MDVSLSKLWETVNDKEVWHPSVHGVTKSQSWLSDWTAEQQPKVSFPGGLVVKNLPASAGDIRNVGLIPALGRSPGGGHGRPLQCSCLENPTDRGALWATVHGVTESQTWLKQCGTHAEPESAYDSFCEHAGLNRKHPLTYYCSVKPPFLPTLPHLVLSGFLHSSRKNSFCLILEIPAKSRLESNPTPTSDTQRAQIKPCAHKDTGTP